jgi:probable rRNA maturation factor
MSDPPSLTVGTDSPVVVVGADEQSDVDLDVDRWCRLAALTLRDAGGSGELTLTFVDRAEIAALNEQHLGKAGPTDVLSFPLDAAASDVVDGDDDVPVLLGDVVICPAVARDQTAAMRAEELAVLVAHHWAGPPPPAFRQEQD